MQNISIADLDWILRGGPSSVVKNEKKKPKSQYIVIKTFFGTNL